MSIGNFLKTVTNAHVARLIEKKLARGCNLIVRSNDSAKVGGRYVCGHGGYTVLEVK